MKLYELLSTHSTMPAVYSLSHTHTCSLTRQTHTNQRFNQSIKYQAVTAQRSANGSSRQEGRNGSEIPPGMEVQEPRQPMRQPLQRPQEGHDDERQRLVYIQVHPPLEFLGAAGSCHVGLSSFYHSSASQAIFNRCMFRMLHANRIMFSIFYAYVILGYCMTHQG